MTNIHESTSSIALGYQILTRRHLHKYTTLHDEDQPSPNHIYWLDSLRPSGPTVNTQSTQTHQQWPSNPVIGFPELCPPSSQPQMLRNGGNFPLSPKFSPGRHSGPGSFDLGCLRPVDFDPNTSHLFTQDGLLSLQKEACSFPQHHFLCLFISSASSWMQVSLKFRDILPHPNKGISVPRFSVSVPCSHFT